MEHIALRRSFGNDERGGTASKRPVDGAGSAAAMDGASKSLTGDRRPQPLGRRQTDAGAHSPLENRQTDAGFPHRQQAPAPGRTYDHGNQEEQASSSRRRRPVGLNLWTAFEVHAGDAAHRFPAAEIDGASFDSTPMRHEVMNDDTSQPRLPSQALSGSYSRFGRVARAWSMVLKKAWSKPLKTDSTISSPGQAQAASIKPAICRQDSALVVRARVVGARIALGRSLAISWDFQGTADRRRSNLPPSGCHSSESGRMP